MKYPIYKPFPRACVALADRILSWYLRSKKIPITPPKTLLLCNGAHLGDVILTTAFLPQLKQAFPNIRIGFLAGSWGKQVIELHPGISWIHCVDHWKLNRDPKMSMLQKFRRYRQTFQAALGAIEKIGYDMAVDFPFHFPNSAFLLWQARIPLRIGFESAGLGPLLTHALPWSSHSERPALESFASLMRLFMACDPSTLHPDLPGVYPKENYIVLHMGTGDPRKQWPLANWKSLAERLEKKGHTLFFTGHGETEEKAIATVSKGLMHSKNVCSRLSWQAFAACIAKARLLICGDTCAGHIAAAYHTPSVLLCPGIHPQQTWKPPSNRTILLTHPVPCSPCFTGCPEMPCVQNIPLESVCQAVQKALEIFPMEKNAIPDISII